MDTSPDKTQATWGAETHGKRIVHGVECVDRVVWTGFWQPGHVHTKVLVLKNVQSVGKKLKCRYPRTKSFITDYTREVSLPPGTSVKIPVAFKPFHKEKYTDCLTFELQNGDSITVDLIASPPAASVTFASHLDMGMCCLGLVEQRTVNITNPSSVDTHFAWSCIHPFSVEPLSGMLKGKETIACQFFFSPNESVPYAGIAVCRFTINSLDDDFRGITQLDLNGVGKLPKVVPDLGQGSDRGPHHGTNLQTLDFGNVAVDTEVVKHMHLRNTSRVLVEYTLTWQESSGCDGADVFSVPDNVSAGIIKPLESVKVLVSCRPKRVGSTACHTLVLDAVGGQQAERVQCVAECAGPSLRASVGHLAFSCQPIGQQQTKIFTLHNTSSVPAVFEFTPNSKEIFDVTPQQGTLAGNTQTSVQVTFKPTKPFCFHRIAMCMVHHQEPIQIHFIGTGYTEQVNPVELLPVHLDQMKSRLLKGLAGLGPETLHRLATDGKLKTDGTFLSFTENQPIAVPLHLQSKAVANLAVNNFVTQAQNTSYCLTGVDRWHVDFGAVTTGVSEAEPITLVNSTEDVVSVQWITEEGSKFTIRPAARSLEPGTRCCFHLKCEPGVGGQSRLFNTTLQCFCMYRAMLDHGKLKQPFQCMAWSFPLTATAHSYKFKEEISRPDLKLDRTIVSLPPTVAGKPTHGTVVMLNTGTVPAHYSAPYSRAQSLTVWPSSGTVHPKQHKVLTVMMTSSESKCLRDDITLMVNQQFAQDLTVVSSTEEPSVEISSNNKHCYFAALCCGHVGERQVQVTNTSSSPLCFKWVIVSEEDCCFSVDPEEGFMGPYESQTHHFFHLPSDEGRVSVTAILEFWNAVEPATLLDGVGAEDQTPNDVHHQDITLVAVAVKPSLQATHIVPRYDQVVVGNASRRMVEIFNPAPAIVPFKLVYSAPASISVDFSPAIALLAPLTKRELTVTVLAAEKGKVAVHIYAVFVNDLGEELVDVAPLSLCTLHLKAVYPVLQISNVAAAGSAERVDKSRLWRMTGVHSFNTLVKKKPTPGERVHDSVTRTSMRLATAFTTPASVDLHLGTGVYGSEPSTVYWTLNNNRLVECYWQVAYPTDLQVQVDSWAEEMLTVEEAMTFHYLKSSTFTVSPKSGCVMPGGSCVIKFKYEHHISGENTIPVVLKIREGREIKLQLHGTTVPVVPAMPYAMWPSQTHTFHPVAVRSRSPPVQPFTLYNDGTLDLRYSVDETIINELDKLCAGHSPLTCQNPRGVIPARGCLDVRFVFSPRAIHKYKFDVDIRTGNDDSVGGNGGGDGEMDCQRVTFYGSSFDYPVLNETELDVLVTGVSEEIARIQPVPHPGIPGRQALLSSDTMVFGAFPVRAKTSQPVWLNSCHLSHDVQFRWTIPDDLQGQLAITPECGVLSPEQSVMCQFYMLCDEAKVITSNVTCRVVDQHDQLEYERDVSDWERARLEDKVHFTITEKDLVEQKAAAEAEAAMHDDMVVKLDGSTRWPTGRTAVHRPAKRYTYKTLPPAIPVFGHKVANEYEAWKQSDLSTRSTTRPRQKKSGSVPKPKEPRVATLHLLVTGCSYVLEDFRCLFPEQASSFLPIRDLSRADTDASAGDVAIGPGRGDVVHADVIARHTTHIANRLVQDLLEAHDFQAGLADVARSAIPNVNLVLRAPLTHTTTGATTSLAPAKGVMAKSRTAVNAAAQTSRQILDQLLAGSVGPGGAGDPKPGMPAANALSMLLKTEVDAWEQSRSDYFKSQGRQVLPSRAEEEVETPPAGEVSGATTLATPAPSNGTSAISASTSSRQLPRAVPMVTSRTMLSKVVPRRPDKQEDLDEAIRSWDQLPAVISEVVDRMAADILAESYLDKFT